MTDSTINTANNENNNNEELSKKEHLAQLETTLRADFESGKLDDEGVWNLISGHVDRSLERYMWNCNASAAMMAASLQLLNTSVEIAVEETNQDERFTKIQTVMQMQRDTLWARYDIKACMEDENEVIDEQLDEINTLMSVTSVFQDICYLSAFCKEISAQMVESASKNIEEFGPTEDRFYVLKIWKEIAAAADLANSMI